LSNLLLTKQAAPGVKWWLLLVSRDIPINEGTAALGVGHFPKDAAAGTGNAFDGGERAIRVDGDVHGGQAVGIAILGGDLAAGGKSSDDLLGGEESQIFTRIPLVSGMYSATGCGSKFFPS
jgi:hypothetical protein